MSGGWKLVCEKRIRDTNMTKKAYCVLDSPRLGGVANTVVETNKWWWALIRYTLKPWKLSRRLLLCKSKKGFWITLKEK